MTEEEWMAATDPQGMLFEAKASERKHRLFVVACCHRIEHLITDQRSRAAVEVGERSADGLAKRREVKAAMAEAKLAEEAFRDAGDWSKFNAAFSAWLSVSCRGEDYYGQSDAANAAGYAVELAGERPQRTEHIAQTTLARDIFGNPFRPVSFDPAWRTATAVSLASQMYGSRDFGAMPILADALQDAGCASDDILGHCRGPGPHARGCWVVDLVLGKS